MHNNIFLREITFPEKMEGLPFYPKAAMPSPRRLHLSQLNHCQHNLERSLRMSTKIIKFIPFVD